MELKSDADIKKAPSEKRIIKEAPREEVEEAEIKNKLPSVQIADKSSSLQKDWAAELVTAKEEQKEQAMALDVPQPSAVGFDPHYCNIEEQIDEMERRIKQENARYYKLIANRDIYDHWMGQEATRGLMRDAAMRLMNFDPNFDA